jgi:hypothetical protein
MPTHTVKTAVGVFRVNVSDNETLKYDPVKGQVKTHLGYNIAVGGKNVCIFIKTHNNSTTAELVNLKTKDGGCELLDRVIRGTNTVHMILLAFTLAKDVSPHITHITLRDKSGFICTLPDGSPAGISLAFYELCFHGATYYERHFGARITLPQLQSMYETAKLGFSKPIDTSFEIDNPSLQILLEPLIKSSSSWRELFDKINRMPEKCAIIQPWYIKALESIMDGLVIGDIQWSIDLSNTSYISPIAYSYVSLHGGSRTHKRKRGVPLHQAAIPRRGEVQFFGGDANTPYDLYNLPNTRETINTIKYQPKHILPYKTSKIQEKLLEMVV